jgi:hypothetical protein
MNSNSTITSKKSFNELIKRLRLATPDSGHEWRRYIYLIALPSQLMDAPSFNMGETQLFYLRIVAVFAIFAVPYRYQCKPRQFIKQG